MQVDPSPKWQFFRKECAQSLTGLAQLNFELCRRVRIAVSPSHLMAKLGELLSRFPWFQINEIRNIPSFPSSLPPGELQARLPPPPHQRRQDPCMTDHSPMRENGGIVCGGPAARPSLAEVSTGTHLLRPPLRRGRLRPLPRTEPLYPTKPQLTKKTSPRKVAAAPLHCPSSLAAPRRQELRLCQ